MSVRAIAFAIMGLLISMGATTYIMAKDMERINREREARQTGGSELQGGYGPQDSASQGAQPAYGGETGGAYAPQGGQAGEAQAYANQPEAYQSGSYESAGSSGGGTTYGDSYDPATEQSYEDSALATPDAGM